MVRPFGTTVGADVISNRQRHFSMALAGRNQPLKIPRGVLGSARSPPNLDLAFSIVTPDSDALFGSGQQASENRAPDLPLVPGLRAAWGKDLRSAGIRASRCRPRSYFDADFESRAAAVDCGESRFAAPHPHSIAQHDAPFGFELAGLHFAAPLGRHRKAHENRFAQNWIRRREIEAGRTRLRRSCERFQRQQF